MQKKNNNFHSETSTHAEGLEELKQIPKQHLETFYVIFTERRKILVEELIRYELRADIRGRIKEIDEMLSKLDFLLLKKQ